MNLKTTYTVVIIGSCVTRDAFDLVNDKRWALDAYFARSGLASAMAEEEFQGVALTGIESVFQRRMVEQDLAKGLPRHLADDTSDLVIYDPIDERFDLAVHPDSGAVCTLSAEISRASYVPVGRTVRSGTDEFYELWEQGWERLIAALDARGRRGCLRVNAARWATRLDDGSAFPELYSSVRIERANAFLDRLYTRMRRDIQPDQFVTFVGPGADVAASDHRWGKSPFHYQAAFYDHLRAALRRSLRESAVPDERHARFTARPTDRRFVFDAAPDSATGETLLVEFRLSSWEDVSYVAIGCVLAGTYFRMLLSPVQQDGWVRVALPRDVLTDSNGGKCAASEEVPIVRFYVSGRPALDGAALEVRTATMIDRADHRTGPRNSETLWVEGWHPRYQLPIAEEVPVSEFSPAPQVVALYPVSVGKFRLWTAVGVRGSERLAVGFHGAADRRATEYPYFERMASRKESPWSFILFSDPTLTLDPALGLGWFLGTADLDLTPVIRELVEKVATVTDARATALTGGSGGGFAALQLSARIPGSIAVVFAPQTDLPAYENDDWERAATAVFGSSAAQHDPATRRRISAVETYRHGTRNLVDYVINEHDTHHVRDHCAPFAALFGLTPEGGVSGDGRVRILPVDLGAGHVPVPREKFEEALNSAFSRLEAYHAKP